jgi:hypothetical protein
MTYQKYHARLYINKNGQMYEVEDSRLVWKGTSTLFDFVNAVIDNIWEKRYETTCPNGKYIISELPCDLNQLIDMFPFQKCSVRDLKNGRYVRDLNGRKWSQTCDVPIANGNARVRWDTTFEQACGNARELYLLAELRSSPYAEWGPERTLKVPGRRQDEIDPCPTPIAGSWYCYNTKPRVLRF